ncbi:hypothetical protein B0G69_6559 [Paraburkholderia sp. RAU2J]|nr:hypothetical protein B0G69_6559 [Paraburkholderia sp. RAU2J]
MRSALTESPHTRHGRVGESGPSRSSPNARLASVMCVAPRFDLERYFAGKRMKA